MRRANRHMGSTRRNHIVNRLWRSELELRTSLAQTLRTQHPQTPSSEIERAVDSFLTRDDCDGELPEVWKQRWRDDREAQRRGR